MTENNKGKFLVVYDWDNGYTCSCCGDSGTNISDCFSTRKEAEEWIIKQKSYTAARKKMKMDISYMPYNFKIVEIIWSEEDEEGLGQESEEKISIETQMQKEELEQKKKKNPLFDLVFSKES